MKNLLSAIFFCLLLNSVCAQIESPYQLNWKTDGGLGAMTLVLVGGDYFLNQNLEPLSLQEINNLNKNDIYSFDREATENWSEAAAHRSDIGLIATPLLAMSATFYIPKKVKKQNTYFQNFLTLGVIGLETNLLTYLGTDIIKSTTKRTRPFVYNPAVSIIEKTDIDSRKSFFSGHTSITAANSFYFAKIFSDYFPESKYKALVWSLAVAIPAWTATERVLAGKHFPTDVIAAYAFGAAMGYFVPQFHKKKEKPGSSSFFILPVSSPVYSGISLGMTF
jgi:membrane-associated phospholipid phosphatase